MKPLTPISSLAETVVNMVTEADRLNTAKKSHY